MKHRDADKILKTSQTRGPERAILLALIIRSNDNNTAAPGLTRLAQDAGLDRRTVTRHLRALVAAGAIEIDHGTANTHGGRQACNIYRIKVGAENPHQDGAKVGAASPQRWGQSAPRTYKRTGDAKPRPHRNTQAETWAEAWSGVAEERLARLQDGTETPAQPDTAEPQQEGATGTI